MRILFVNTSLLIGGAEKLMVDMLPMLQAKSHNVELLIFDGTKTPFYKDLENKGIKIHSFNKANVYNPIIILEIIPYLKRFDIIHVHNTAPEFYVAIASIFHKKKLIYTEHGTDNRRRHINYFKIFDNWCYRQYDTVACISTKAEENLRKYLGDNHPVKITTINNGVDVSRYKNASPNAEVLAEKQKDFIVTMIAGFRHQKDQDTLIRAISRLPETIKLWLVGDGVRREELKTLSEELKIDKRVKFWGIRNDVPAILKASDIVVMSSHHEGLSLSSVEGMASGRPMIASDVDGLREVVEGYGLLFPHQDDEALAKAIENLYSNSELYKKVSDACLLRASQFDIDKMVCEYEQLYYKIISDK